MNISDEMILLRAPKQWLEDRKAELAQHPLYGSLSEYLVNMVDCGIAALNAPHACMQRGEGHWECKHLKKEADNDVLETDPQGRI